MRCVPSMLLAERSKPNGRFERALRIGDQATHGRTLTELYGKMASRPFAVDLNYLWEQLGVGENGPNPKTPLGAGLARPFAASQRRKGERA